MNVTATLYHDVLNKYKSARYAIFTDMIENSMLDMIVVSDTVTDSSSLEAAMQLPKISAIYNNLNGEMFYIKARMLTD